MQPASKPTAATPQASGSTSVAPGRGVLPSLLIPSIFIPSLLLLGLTFFTVSATAAQRGGGGAGGPGGMGGMGGGPGVARPPFGNELPDRGMSQTRGNNDSTLRSELQLAPPGRWWDDKRFSRSLGLDSNQQKRMDDVFNANKNNLATLYKNLQREEKQLEKVVHAKELDETQIFQQIDRVTQARGELEKAYSHMQLQIRKEMTPEQASRLDDFRASQ